MIKSVGKRNLDGCMILERYVDMVKRKLGLIKV